jgi:hypothetical protein
MNVIMPQVFDKISMRNDTIRWNFGNYIPDLVTVCLGQNDGIQDSAKFVSNYIVFLDQLRKYYPRAGIFCISSPMADDALCSFMKKSLAAVFQHYNSTGDKKLFTFVFQKQYHHGCDGHPDLTEHREIAALLTEYIREKMKW